MLDDMNDKCEKLDCRRLELGDLVAEKTIADLEIWSLVIRVWH